MADFFATLFLSINTGRRIAISIIGEDAPAIQDPQGPMLNFTLAAEGDDVSPSTCSVTDVATAS